MSKRSLAVLAAAACLCAAKPAAPYPNDQTNFLLVRDGTRFEERRDLFRNRRPHASFEGAFAFVDESWSYGRKTEFKATHEFDLEKSGIRFPTRTAFQVGYFREYDPGGRTRNGRPLRFTVPKATAEIRYRDYRFFTVEVETKIKSSARPSETEGR